MPRIDKNSVFDTENDFYFKAIVYSINYVNETVDVKKINTPANTEGLSNELALAFEMVYDIPVFFHCHEDSDTNSIGGLVRGIYGIKIGDEVIVSITPETIVYSEKLRFCNKFPVVQFVSETLDGTVMLVYDVTNNNYVNYNFSSNGACNVPEAFNINKLTSREYEFYEYFILKGGNKTEDTTKGFPFNRLSGYTNKLANLSAISILGRGICKEYGTKTFCEGPGFTFMGGENHVFYFRDYWTACGDCEKIMDCEDDCKNCGTYCDKCIPPCIKKYSASAPTIEPAQGCSSDGQCYTENILESPFLCTYPNDFTYTYPKIVIRNYDKENKDSDIGWFHPIPFPIPSKVDSFFTEFTTTIIPEEGVIYKDGYHYGYPDIKIILDTKREEVNVVVNLYGIELNRATTNYFRNKMALPYISGYNCPASSSDLSTQNGSIENTARLTLEEISELEGLGYALGDTEDSIVEAPSDWFVGVRRESPYEEQGSLSLSQFTENSQELTIETNKLVVDKVVHIKIEKTESLKLFALVTPLGTLPEIFIEDIKTLEVDSAVAKTYLSTASEGVPLENFEVYKKVCRDTDACGICEGEYESDECYEIRHCYDQKMIGRRRFERSAVSDQTLNFFDNRDPILEDTHVNFGIEEIDQIPTSFYYKKFVYGTSPRSGVDESYFWIGNAKTELDFKQKAYDFGELTFRIHYREFTYTIFDWPGHTHQTLRSVIKKEDNQTEIGDLRSSLNEMSLSGLTNYMHANNYNHFIKTEVTYDNQPLIVEEIINLIYECSVSNKDNFELVLSQLSVLQIKEYIVNYKMQSTLGLNDYEMQTLEEDDLPEIVEGIMFFHCPDIVVCPDEEITALRVLLTAMSMVELINYLETTQHEGVYLSQLIKSQSEEYNKEIIIEDIIAIFWSCYSCTSTEYKGALNSLSTNHLGDYLVDYNLDCRLNTGEGGEAIDVLYFLTGPEPRKTLDELFDLIDPSGSMDHIWIQQLIDCIFNAKCLNTERLEIAYYSYEGSYQIRLCSYNDNIRYYTVIKKVNCDENGENCDEIPYQVVTYKPIGENLLAWIYKTPPNADFITTKIVYDTPLCCVDFSQNSPFSAGKHSASEMPKVKKLMDESVFGFKFEPNHSILLSYIAPEE